MPITGKFLADFASFYDAVQQAEVSLRSFETGASKVEKQLNKTADAFSGRKIIADAELAVRAVNDIGGATRLTEAEQRRLNATLSEAIAKTRALGFEASKDMVALANATKQTNTEFAKLPSSLSGLTSTLTGIAGAFGVAFSIGAVVNFGKEIFRAGDEIQKMADKTSMGTEEVQKLDFVASQAGVSFDGMVGAVQNLQQRLGDNDKGVIGAFAELGINVDEFIKLKPSEQVFQLSEAISKIPEPTRRAAIEADVFGKTWKEIAPAITANIREIADQTPLIADSTIKTLDATGDAFDKFWRMIKSNAANQIGLVILSIQALPKEINMAFKAMHLDVEGAKKDIQDLGAWWDVLIGKLEKPPKVALSQQVKQAFSGAGVPQIKLTPDDISGIENALNQERKALDEASRAADTHAKAIAQLADRLSGADLARQMRDLDEATMRLIRQERLDAAAKERVADAAGKLWRAGVPLTPQLFDIAFAMGELDPKLLEGAAGFGDLGESVRLAIPELNDVGALLPKVTIGIGDLLNQLPKMDLGYQFRIAKPHIDDARRSVLDLSQALADIASVSSGAFSNIITDISVFVRSLDVANSAFKTFKGGLSAFKDGGALGGILSMTSGILGMAAAAIAAGKALANLFDRNKGRDLVVDFAEMHGGFEKLHNDLLAIGPEGEQLWIRFTQGVGRNNPAQAQAAIDAINEALARHKEALDDAADAATEMGEAESEAVQQAKAAIQALNDQIKGLQNSIANEAPEEVMGIVEAQARAQIAALEDQRDAAQQALDETGAAAAEMAQLAASAFQGEFTDAADAAAAIMADNIRSTLKAADFVARLRFEYELPENIQIDAGLNLPGFASGTRGQFLNFGAGTPVMLHGRERIETEGERTGSSSPIVVPVYLDGRQIAEATVRHAPAVIRQYGLA